ncbi:DNA topoisomerase I, partial [bacterium]|nr:DNA topoisomerase I [bacterium]
PLLFRANGSVVRFPGFLKVYGDRGQDTLLPEMHVGQEVGGQAARDAGGLDVLRVTHAAHETQPPARYTEASLIKKLEEEGIGRPSTYASVIATIQSRDYVAKKGGALLPTYIGIAVTHLLREHFPRYVDVAFTARMEEELDQIAEGERDWIGFLDAFYRGGDGGAGLEKDIAAGLDRIEFPRIRVGDDPGTGAPIVLRIGRNYVSVNVEGDEARRATVPVDLLIDELTPARALELITQRDRSREPIGRHPETGQDIYVLTGPFGPYLQLGQQEGDRKPKRISLGAKTDLSTIDLDYALRLLSLPRVIGADPASGKPVRAGLGRFGPYVEHERVFASVASVDELFTITLEQALERIRNKNRRPVLRELGPHPESGLPLVICKGRYGPYVTDGKVNGTIGRDTDPEEITVDEAVALLAAAAERAAQNGGRPARGRRTAKKAPARGPAPRRAAKKVAPKAPGTAGRKVAKKASAAKGARTTAAQPAAAATKTATKKPAGRKPATRTPGSGKA